MVPHLILNHANTLATSGGNYTTLQSETALHGRMMEPAEPKCNLPVRFSTTFAINSGSSHNLATEDGAARSAQASCEYWKYTAAGAGVSRREVLCVRM